MGWTFTDGATREAIIAKLTREVPRQPAFHWSSSEQKPVPSGHDFSRTTLHHSAPEQDVLWTVEELVLYKEREERTRSIGCYLLKESSDGAGYKPMGESMHTYYYTCPLAYYPERYKGDGLRASCLKRWAIGHLYMSSLYSSE